MKARTPLFRIDRLLIAALALLAAPQLQAQLYTGTNSTGFWSTNRWSTSTTGPYGTTWVANTNAIFLANGTYTFSGMVSSGTLNVGDVTVQSNVTVTFSAAQGNLGTGGLVRTFDIATNSIFDMGSQTISTAAGTGFIKTGSGVWFVNQNNSYGGGFTLNGGTFSAGNNGSLGTGASHVLTLSNGVLAANANRDFNSTRFAGGIRLYGNIQFGAMSNSYATNARARISDSAGLLFANNVDLGSATRTMTIGNNGAHAFSGVISNGGLTINAAAGVTGTMTFSNTNTYTNKTTLNSGTLVLSGSGTAGATNSDLEVAGGLLNLSAGTKTNAAFLISGGAITNGTLEATTYALNGGTVAGNLGAGTINVGGNTALNGTTAATTINVNSGTLTLGSGSRFTGTTPAVTMAGGTLALGGAESIGSLAGSSGTVSLGGNALTVGGANTSTTYSGGISGASGALIKAGTGTLTLGGTSTYTGATTVTNGTLNVTGTLSASSAVGVGTGALLTGSGTVGAVTVNSGGTISAGAGVGSAGTLSVSSLAVAGTSTYRWELANVTGTAGTDWDLISSSGVFNFASLTTFTIDIRGNWGASGFDSASNYSWRIIDAASLSGAFNPSLFTFTTNNATGLSATGAWTFSETGSDVFLNYSAPVVSSEYIWNVTSGLWSTGGNWSGGPAPTNGSSLTFAGAGGASTNDDGFLNNVAGITFSNSAGSYTLSGSAFTNGANGIVNNSASAQTISNDITLGAAQSFNAAAGDLTFAGAINNNANLLTVAGSSNTVMSGAISGSGGLTKTGNGSLTLGANNSFTGALAANGGMTLLNGTQDMTTVNVGGGTLLLGGNHRLADGATLTLSSGTVNFGGFSDTISTFNISSGVFTNGTATATTYGLSGGTVGGTLSGGTANVTGGVTLSGSIASTLNINSGGTLTLAVADGIGASSAVTINAGTLATATFNDTIGSLVLTNGGSITGSGIITAGTYALQGGTVNAGLGAGAITVTGGTTTLGSAGRLNSASTLTINSGQLTLGGAEAVAALSGAGGTLALGANTLTFGDSSNTTFSGVISGSGGLTKSGNGTVTFNNAATSFGTLTAGAGVTAFATNARITGLAGSGTLNLAGGTLTLTNTSAQSFSGSITGAGGFTKTGAETLTLSGSGSYSGPTTIAIGTILVAANNGLSTNSAVTVGVSLAPIGTSRGQLSIGDGFSQAITGLTLFGGATNTNSGRVIIGTGSTLTVNGNITYENANNASYPSAISGGTLDLGGSNRIITVFTNGNSTVGGDLGIDSVIANGSIVKESSGILRLSGANTFAGTFSNNAGVLWISNANALQNATLDVGADSTARTVSFIIPTATTYNIGALTGGDALAISNNTLSVGGNNQSTTFSGILSGTGGGFTKVGTGTITLSGANTYSGATAINAGAVRATVAAALGGTATNTVVANGAALELAGGFSLNAEPIQISGSGISNGGAIRNISGVNTNTGFITLASDSRINSDADLLVISTAGADANAITGNFNLSLGGAGNFEFRDRIAIGTGALTKDGAGTLTIGSAATHSGGTILSAGTIRLGVAANNSLGTGTLTLNGGILANTTGATLRTLTNNVVIGGNIGLGDGISVGPIALSGPVDLGSANRVLTVLNGATLSGAVSGAGGAITKAGSGTLTLSSSNSFTGGTTVNGGILRLANTGAAGSGSITQLDGSSQIEIDVAGTITNDMNAYVIDFLQSANLSGSITMNGTVIDAGPGISATNSGLLIGSGGMTKTSVGTLTLTQNNTYSGATTVNGGRLIVNGSQSSSAVTVNSGASLAGTGTVGALTVSGLLAPGASVGTLSAGNTVLNGGGSFELEIFDWVGAPGGGWDLLAVTGDLTLSSTALSPFTINLVSLTNSTTPGFSTGWNQNVSFTNTFISYSGNLIGAFATNLFTINTGSFSNAVNGTFSITNVTGGLALLYSTFYVPPVAFEWNSGSGAWADGANWVGASAPTAGADIIFTGAGGNSTNNQLSSIGSLAFSNTAGSYTISGDAFTNGINGVVNNAASAQTISNAIILGASQSFNAAAGSLTFGGNITNAGNALTVDGAANTLISGAISGSGSLTKVGASSLTLSGANTYNGGTTVSAGRLIGDSSSLQGAILNNAAITFDQLTNGTYGGVLSGSGSLTKQGGGTLLLSASNTYSGGTTINAGTIQINGASRLGVVGGALTINDGELQLISQSLSSGRNIVLGHANSAIEVDAGLRYTATNTSVISGGGTLNKRGEGTLSLYGANTYTGGNFIAAGTLEGDTTSLQGTITNNAVLTFRQATNGTYSSAITGNGSLVKSGVGSLTLVGANDYSGGTLVSAGTLVGSTTSLQGPITNNSMVVMSQSGNGTYSGALSGNGGFTKSGSGTITLGGNNSGYGGAIDLQAGGLVASHNNALGTGAVTLTNGSIQAAGGVSIANNFTIGAPGSVVTNTSTNNFTAYWNFGTNAGSASATTVSSVGVSFGDVSRGNNNGTTTLLENTASSSGYTGASGLFNAAAAVAGGALSNSTSAYFEFTLTPSSGYQVSLTNLTFGSRSTGTGPALATLLSSLDSYVAALATNSLSTASAWQLISPTVTASTLTNGAVTFRLYGSAGTGNTANVWRIDDLNLAGFTITNSVVTNSPTGSGTLGISEAGSATFSGSIVNNTQATLTAVTNGSANFSGAISGVGSLTKTGLGTVTLSGASANTLTGTTTVSAGTLQLNKATDVAAIAGNLTVNSGATLLLSSSGNVADTSAVTLSGGTIRRGGDVSEIFGSLNLTEASFLDYGADNAIGTLTFAGTYTPSALLTVQNFLPGSKLQFNNSLTSEQLNNPSFFAFSNGFTTGTEGGYFTITAIPEPSTYLAAAGLLGLMLWPSRKRLIKDARKILGFRAPMRDRLAARRA